jgi:hypothetical protein
MRLFVGGSVEPFLTLVWLVMVIYDLDHFNELLLKILLSTIFGKTYSLRIVFQIFFLLHLIFQKMLLCDDNKCFEHKKNSETGVLHPGGWRCSNAAFLATTFQSTHVYPSSGLLSISPPFLHVVTLPTLSILSLP